MRRGYSSERGRGQAVVYRVLALGQVLLGLCARVSHKGAPPRLPFHLAAGVIPDQPSVSQPKPYRHLVRQNPRSNSPREALGPSCRYPFRQGVKHGPKGDPNPNAPQHLWGRMISQRVSWSVNTQAINRGGRTKDQPGIRHSTCPCDQNESNGDT